MTAMRITHRDEVQAGDRVTYGSLGYIHTGIARDIDGGGEPLEPGHLQVNRGGSWYADFLSADRFLPTGYYIGSTQNVGGIHAARPDTMFEDGFARALCRRTLWVLVNHVGNDTPVEALHPEAPHREGAEAPSCLRCCAALNRLAR